MRVFFVLLVIALYTPTFSFAAKVAKPVETFFLDRIWLQPFERTLDETERLNRLLNPLGMSFNPGILRSNRPPIRLLTNSFRTSQLEKAFSMVKLSSCFNP